MSTMRMGWCWAAAERLRVEDHSGGTVEYTYDERGQLTEEDITEPDGGVRVINFTYDPAGNRLTKNDNGVIISYTYDDNDRLLTEGDITYSYDNNGNLLSRTEPGLEQRFTYDALNQLIHAEVTSSQGTSTVDYVYDHDGIRVGKTINGTDEVTYLVDANRPYAQVLEEEWTRGGLSATTNYVYGHGLVSQNIDGNHRFYHYDGFHNTRSLTDMDGAVTDTYRYDAYGMLQEQSGSTKNSYLCRGEQFDADIDSYYLRARYYQPDTGRFLSTDPVEGDIADPMTLHRYLYANNDPVNNIDPSGTITLQNALVTSGIIGTLSGIGWIGGIEPLEGVYEDIADWFPDAGIIGLSAFTKIVSSHPTGPMWNGFKGILTGVQGILGGIGMRSPYSSFNGWWMQQSNIGFIVGAEALWSFGSSQRGLFWYFGVQGETGWMKGLRGKKPRLDVTLYTGYTFNLWNCQDYTGDFASLNFPIGSFFFDPLRVSRNTGPWGLSWPIISKSFDSGNPSWNVKELWRSGATSSQMFGGNWTGFRTVMSETEVPYGKLAVEWGLSQATLATLSALDGNNLSAVATWVGLGSTGLIAKSKQIYNKNRNIGDIRTTNKPTRPDGWRSGPQNPLSRMISLFL